MGGTVQSGQAVQQYTPTRELTLERLIKEVMRELLDGNFLHLTHGRPATYNKGCRGHLCTYINRTRRREARRIAMQAKLPNGVVPDTRSRQEQYWDGRICEIIVMMEEIREDIAQNRELLEKEVDKLMKELGIE